MYQVQFKTSGIVAFSSHDRGLCTYFIECNDYGPDRPIVDLETKDITGYTRGDCLNLFVLRKVKL